MVTIGVLALQGDVAASFHLPLAGALFALELLLVEMTTRAVVTQGLGSYLLLASMQDLNELNGQEFQIVVENQNTRALKLYKKLGFKEMTEVVYLKEK